MNKLLSHLHFSLIKSQAWVSFCVALLVWFFQIVHGYFLSDLIWLSFFSTLLAYNFAYWADEKKINWRLVVMLIASIFSVFFFFRLNYIFTQILIVFSGIISILYSIPIHRFSLRKIPSFKIIWIALVWTITTILFFFEVNGSFNSKVIYTSITTFLFIVGITIPFDIRDYYTDSFGLKTIPQKIGIKNSKYLSISLLVISMIVFYISNHSKSSLSFISYAITILFGILMIFNLKKKSSKWLVSFGIEGLSALPFLILQILWYLIS